MQYSDKDASHLSLTGKAKNVELDPYRYAPFYTLGFTGLKESAFFLHLHGNCTILLCILLALNYVTKRAPIYSRCDGSEQKLRQFLQTQNWPLPPHLVPYVYEALDVASTHVHKFRHGHSHRTLYETVLH